MKADANSRGVWSLDMLLAIDCAGPRVSVCAGTHQDNLVSRGLNAKLNHNEILAAAVWEVLDLLDESVPDRVAVNVGPGTFTGTRVGVSFAVGIAQGWGIPIIPVTSFELAIGMAPASADRVAVALPIVRNLWCRVFMLRGDSGWEEGEIEELDRASVSIGLNQTPLLAPLGDISGAIMTPPDWCPSCELWKVANDSNETTHLDPAMVRVRYVGPSQAERNFRDRRRAVEDSNR